VQIGKNGAEIDLFCSSSRPISRTASSATVLDVDRVADVRGAGVVVELEPRLVLVEAGALPPHQCAARRADEHREDV
jgi:hypothetical protein